MQTELLYILGNKNSGDLFTLVIFTLLQRSGTEPIISPRYACILKVKLGGFADRESRVCRIRSVKEWLQAFD